MKCRLDLSPKMYRRRSFMDLTMHCLDGLLSWNRSPPSNRMSACCILRYFGTAPKLYQSTQRPPCEKDKQLRMASIGLVARCCTLATRLSPRLRMPEFARRELEVRAWKSRQEKAARAGHAKTVPGRPLHSLAPLRLQGSCRPGAVDNRAFPQSRGGCRSR